MVGERIDCRAGRPGGLGAGVQLLLAREVLARRLDESVDESVDDLLGAALPWLIALVVLTVLLSLVKVVQNTLSQVLAEAVSVRATEAILDVAASVEPEESSLRFSCQSRDRRSF